MTTYTQTTFAVESTFRVRTAATASVISAHHRYGPDATATDDATVMCEICDHIESLLVNKGTVQAKLVSNAYVTGFARGFNIRSKAAYSEFCSPHAVEMKLALVEAGTIDVPLVLKGDA